MLSFLRFFSLTFAITIAAAYPFQRCEAVYAHTMHTIDKRLGLVAERLIRTPPLLISWLNRTKPLIIGANEGSTGSRAVATALAALRLRVAHGPVDDTAWLLGWTCTRGPWVAARLPAWRSCENQTVAQNWERCTAQPPPFEDHAAAFRSVDAVMDTPFGSTWYDLWRAFPTANVLWTHRAASSCGRRSAASTCGRAT